MVLTFDEVESKLEACFQNFSSSWLKSGIFLGDFLANLVNHTQNAEIFTPACKSTVIFAV